jgi:hypothetical protein
MQKGSEGDKYDNTAACSCLWFDYDRGSKIEEQRREDEE